jgi:hypothetical protein
MTFVGESGNLVGAVVNAACHPVHEMCIPRVSPDYPGELCDEVERRHGGSIAMFLNGASGNLNPPVVTGGAGEARRHGLRLADAVDDCLREPETMAQPVEVRLHRRTLRLPARKLDGAPSRRRLRAPLAALGMGDLALVFLPGEPFVEIGLEIRKRSRFGHTMVVGLSDESVGYLPMEQDYEEGGYELGPGAWARAGKGSGETVQEGAIDLLNSLPADRRS